MGRLWSKVKRPQKGQSSLLALGFGLFATMMGVFSVDLPGYMAAQNQLQTAMDAAALAGAYALPDGESYAEAAAMDLALENSVAGSYLKPEDVSVNIIEGESLSLQVTGKIDMPTIIGRFICGFGSSEVETPEQGTEPSSGAQAEADYCMTMPVHASAKAKPAARDTILVVDTSSSMQNLGNLQPFRDVQEAANAYLDQVLALDVDSVDRIGLVSFDRFSDLEIGLTSQQDSAEFDSVRDAIDDMDLYSGGGWNTNFYVGLKEAIDEMERSARKNSTKTIIFMTDGYPNLPEDDARMSDCINYYNHGAYYARFRYWSHANYFYNMAHNCATDYTDHMIGVTQEQVDRAKALGITVHVIQIGGDDSSSLNTFRTLLWDNDWDSGLQTYIADTTKGDMYAAEAYDSEGIKDIYRQVALNVKMRLTG